MVFFRLRSYHRPPRRPAQSSPRTSPSAHRRMQAVADPVPAPIRPVAQALLVVVVVI